MFVDRVLENGRGGRHDTTLCFTARSLCRFVVEFQSILDGDVHR